MQWAVALGCINIMYNTVVLSWYRPAPHKGFIANIQHLYYYLNEYNSTYSKFNTDIPVYDNFKTIEVNWGNQYAGETEYLPH